MPPKLIADILCNNTVTLGSFTDSYFTVMNQKHWEPSCLSIHSAFGFKCRNPDSRTSALITWNPKVNESVEVNIKKSLYVANMTTL